jgi:hypothetical protein
LSFARQLSAVSDLRFDGRRIYGRSECRNAMYFAASELHKRIFMPRMLDLVRQSAVPAGVMRSAAKGALTLPAGEMLEILVFLTSNPVFAEEAKMTLAGWDVASATAVVSDPATPWEVLEYFIAPENLRPKLLPALLENPRVREARLLDLAQSGSREVVEMMLASSRVRKSEHVLHALLTNANLNEAEAQSVRQSLRDLGQETTAIKAYSEVDAQEKTQYEIEHADEIAAEEALGKPFELMGGIADDEELETVAPVEETAAVQAPAEATVAAGELAVTQTANTAAAPQAAPLPEESVRKMRAPQPDNNERISAFQKIAAMGVSQRIQLAIKGSKEERFILVRDGSKLVSQAVLQSPKVSEAEIETFASMKNVQEGVLREIGNNRKFIRNYGVIRNLVNNPRCPLDLSLTLVNHLMVNDLKSLASNKNVADTLRRLALKRYRDKTEKKN